MISSTTRIAGPFAGTGLQTAFGFSFKVFQASDVLVVQTDASGNNTTLTLTSAYTVALNSNQDISPGGTVNMVTAPPSGYTITIGSQVQALQGTNLTNAGNFYPTVVNNALDYLTILIQQILVKVGNSLQLPINVTGVSTTLPTPSASKVIGWNNTGTALQNFSVNDLGSNLAYGQTAAQIVNGGSPSYVLTSSAVTVNNLKVLVGGVGQRPGIDYTLSSDGLTVSFTTTPPAGTNNVCFVWQQALAMGTVPALGVNTAQLVDQSVTAGKLASGAAAANVGALGVTTAMLADQSVTTAKHALNSVTQAILSADLQGATYGMKNRLINGNFNINQRGVSGTVTLTAGQYGHDRFKAGASGCTYTFSTANNVTTLTITAGSLQQVIEGANLESGTYALSWVGTAQGKVGAGSYGTSGAVTATIVGGTNTTCEWNTGTLTLVQLEKGSTATSFDFREYNRELAMCQRYFEKSYDIGTAPGAVTSVGRTFFGGSTDGSGGIGLPINFAVSKRAAPTISFYAIGGTAGQWDYLRSGASGLVSMIADNPGMHGFNAYTTSISVAWGVAGIIGHWVASSEL